MISKAVAQSMRSRSSLNATQAVLLGSRIGVRNRYKYDYACEDEYFEREMTLLEARHLPVPLPEDFRHKKAPINEIMPAHWNDVRFNYLPQNLDRRMFLHDNYMNLYDFRHDAAHTLGYPDEDLDWEMPDPQTAGHYNKARSGAFSILGAVISIGVLVGYPIFGLKMPQKDNPFYWRKKYGTPTTIEQIQALSLIEYGGKTEKGPDSNIILGPNGFDHAMNGLRIDLDNYADLIC
jgi:hypothetical protein